MIFHYKILNYLRFNILNLFERMNKDGIVFGVVVAMLFSGVLYLSLYENKKNPLSEFQQWKAKFNVKYSTEWENSYREKIFLGKLAIIQMHNSNPARTYNRGLNQFSALTKEQFRQTYLTLKSERTFIPLSQNQVEDDLTIGEIDWRKQGAVGPVKDQGHCGSCWAFSATGGLEGLSKIATGKLDIFSEQQLVDCVTGNSGCHGGLMRRALVYVKDNGIALEQEYPYKAVQGECIKPKGSFKLSGYTNITNCIELANALTSKPIMVGVDSQNWDDYESGVFNNCPKQRGEFNHGVLVVGMTKQAWIIKNQWTTQWGENGYMRLARGDTCNVCNDGMLLHK